MQGVCGPARSRGGMLNTFFFVFLRRFAHFLKFSKDTHILCIFCIFSAHYLVFFSHFGAYFFCDFPIFRIFCPFMYFFCILFCIFEVTFSLCIFMSSLNMVQLSFYIFLDNVCIFVIFCTIPLRFSTFCAVVCVYFCNFAHLFHGRAGPFPPFPQTFI